MVQQNNKKGVSSSRSSSTQQSFSQGPGTQNRSSQVQGQPKQQTPSTPQQSSQGSQTPQTPQTPQMRTPQSSTPQQAQPGQQAQPQQAVTGMPGAQGAVQQQPPQRGLKWWMWVLLGLGLLIFLGIVVYFVFG